MPERLLLTGASGFVGRALVAPLLASGFEVHGVGRSAPPPECPLRWHRVDLLDLAETRALLREVRPAVLVHAAWHVAHGAFWTARENAVWRDASEALAAHFATAGGHRLIGVGSCAEYAADSGEPRTPWPETRALAPATAYGRAKAELFARLTRMAQARGLSFAWARLFHLFGEGEHPDRLVPSVARALAAGQEALCASGRPVRDFSPTRHVGAAVAALATSGVTGPVNIASGEGRSIAAVVRVLAEAAGRPDLPRLGALPDRLGEVQAMVADVTRLRREVGFTRPPRVEESLRETMACFRAAALGSRRNES